MDAATRLFVACEQSFGWGVWRVGEQRRIPEQERVVATVGYEVEDRLHCFAADLQANVAMATTALGFAVRHAFGETAALAVAFPPLAALMTQLALLAQQLWDRCILINICDQFIS